MKYRSRRDRYGYSPEQWLVVRIIAQAVDDLTTGLPDGLTAITDDADDAPVGYWRQHAAAYFQSPLFRFHCECIGVEPDARNLNAILRQIITALNMVQ